MDKRIFDKESALDRVGGDLDLLIELAGIFIEDCPSIISRIEQAIQDEDAETLHRSAHTLKGAVGNFSAQATFEAAFELESKGRSKQLEGAREAVESLKHELARLQPALSSM
jgi:HPt (histidine-containing phosphotransfer) domain-containing protein